MRQEQEDGGQSHAERSSHNRKQDDVCHPGCLKKGNRPYDGRAYERPGDGAGGFAKVLVCLRAAIRHYSREHSHRQEKRDGHGMRGLRGEGDRVCVKDAERSLYGDAERHGQRGARTWLRMLVVESQSVRDLARPLRHMTVSPGPWLLIPSGIIRMVAAFRRGIRGWVWLASSLAWEDISLR